MGRDLSTGWQSRAQCYKAGRQFLDYAYSDYVRDQNIAKRVCNDCVVRPACLAYAILNDEEFGIWGGCTRSERIAIRLWGGLLGGFEEDQLAILEGKAPQLHVVPEVVLTWEQELERAFDDILKRDFESGLTSIFDEIA